MNKTQGKRKYFSDVHQRIGGRCEPWQRKIFRSGVAGEESDGR